MKTTETVRIRGPAALDKEPVWPLWLIAAGTLIAVLWASAPNSEQRTMQTLPEHERVALYDRTLQNVRDICTSPSFELRHFCGAQARLLVGLPECRDDCRALIRPFLPQPTR